MKVHFLQTSVLMHCDDAFFVCLYVKINLIETGYKVFI